MIEISAKNVEGIGELEDTLKEMFFQGELTFNDEIYITNVRQKTAKALRGYPWRLSAFLPGVVRGPKAIQLFSSLGIHLPFYRLKTNLL